jgi:hypothetical protein
MARVKNVQEAVVAISSKEVTTNNTYQQLNKQWPWIKKHRGSAAK